MDHAATTTSMATRTRPRRTAVMGLLATLAAGCAEAPSEIDMYDPVDGRVTFERMPIEGARIDMTGGGRSYSAMSDADGRYSVMVPPNRGYMVRTNVTALCPSGSVDVGNGGTTVDIGCFLPKGEAEGTFTLGENGCGFDPAEFGVTLEVKPTIAGGETDGTVKLEFVATNGFTVSGEYDPSTREYVGSSEEVTDENGITSSETWTGTLDFDFDAAVALLFGLSNARFSDQSGAFCLAPADFELILPVEPGSPGSP